MSKKYNTIVISYKELGEDFGFDEEPDPEEMYQVEAIGYTANGKSVLVAVTSFNEPWALYSEYPISMQCGGIDATQYLDADGNPIDPTRTDWVYTYDIEYWEILCKQV